MSALRRSLRVLGLSPPAPTDEPTTPLGQAEEDGNPADNNNNEEELHDDAPAPNGEDEPDHNNNVDTNDNDPAPNLTSRSRRLFNDLTADEELFELELKQKKLELEYNLFQIQGKRRLIEQRKEYERVRQQEARCTNAPVDDDDNTRHVEDVAPSAETFSPTTPTIATPDPVRSPSISVPAPAHDRANMEPHFTVPWMTRVPAPAPITQDSQNTDAILKKLLARQSHAKELPEFSGLPGEWPLFIRQFERSTEVCGLTDDENALRLAKCLKGKAYDSVYSMLGIPENVPLIIDSLRMAFGRPDQIVKSMIAKAKSAPDVLESNYESLIHLSNCVRAIVATMKSMRCFGHMNNPQLLEDLLGKLPFSLKLAWCVLVDDDEPNLEDFSMWLGRQAAAASRMPAAPCCPVPSAPEREKRSKLWCHQCKAPSHNIAQCPEFKKLDVERRWTLTSEKKLCFICLDNGHRTSACDHRRECGTEGCRSLHHPLLHRPINWRNSAPTTN